MLWPLSYTPPRRLGTSIEAADTTSLESARLQAGQSRAGEAPPYDQTRSTAVAVANHLADGSRRRSVAEIVMCLKELERVKGIEPSS